MWQFSHWEVRRESGFLWYRDVWHPVHVWVPEIVIHIEFHQVAARDDTRDRIAQYERETQLTLALKRKVDAESALLDSHLQLAVRKAQLNQLMSLTKRDDLAELEYAPAVEMDEIR